MSSCVDRQQQSWIAASRHISPINLEPGMCYLASFPVCGNSPLAMTLLFTVERVMLHRNTWGSEYCESCQTHSDTIHNIDNCSTIYKENVLSLCCSVNFCNPDTVVTLQNMIFSSSKKIFRSIYIVFFKDNYFNHVCGKALNHMFVLASVLTSTEGRRRRKSKVLSDCQHCIHHAGRRSSGGG